MYEINAQGPPHRKRGDFGGVTDRIAPAEGNRCITKYMTLNHVFVCIFGGNNETNRKFPQMKTCVRCRRCFQCESNKIAPFEANRRITK